MPFVVIYDANALYGNAQRDLLIRIAQSGLVQAKWTDQILDEMLGNLGKKRPDIPPEKLGTLRELMNKAVRDCLGHDRDEGMPQLPRSPDTLDARLPEQGPEVPPDVRGVQWSAHARCEYQAGVLPQRPCGQPRLGLPLAVLPEPRRAVLPCGGFTKLATFRPT